MSDEELMIRKWKRLVDKGKLFESVEFNSQPKMMECYEKLRANKDRKASTFVLRMGDKVLGYWITYLPNWRRVEVVE